MASDAIPSPGSGPKEVTEPELICDDEPAPWKRHKPGTYDLRCLSYKYEQVRMYGNSWKLRLTFQFMHTEHRERIVKFFHMGTGPKPRASRNAEYFRAYVIANGGLLPRKREQWSPRKFVGRVFRCEVRDVTRTIDPNVNHSEGAIYSTVGKIMELCV
jgi:hypothetical protein